MNTYKIALCLLLLPLVVLGIGLFILESTYIPMLVFGVIVILFVFIVILIVHEITH